VIHLYKSLKNLLSPEDFKKITFLSLLLFIIVCFEVFAVLVITFLVSSLTDLDQVMLKVNLFLLHFSIFDSAHSQSINNLLIIIILYICFSVCAYLFVMRYVSLQTQLITSHLKSDFIAATLSTSWMDNINQNSSQRISNVLNDTVQIGFTLIDLMYLLSRTYLAILLILWLFYADPLITTLIFSTLIILYTFIHFGLRASLLRYGELSVEFNQKLVQSLTNMFGHIKEIIFYDSQAKQESALREINLTIAHSTGQKFFLVNIPRFLIDSLILIIMVGGVAYYGNVGGVSENFYSTISIFGIAAIKMLPAIQNIFYYTQQILARKPNLDNLIHFYQNSNDRSFDTITSSFDPIDIEANILFKNIYFEYEHSKTTLFNVSTSIEIGKKIAIVGPSGSGKSTFLDILIGILPPSSGEILVDSRPINLVSSTHYRQNISYVPQKIFLVDGTLKENILLYGGEAFLDMSQEIVLNQSKVSNFLESLEGGLDTMISESSQKISGGEKQCIGFARAFSQDKKIMVLDEATSSMDQDLSTSIINSVFSSSKTVVCATHQAHLLHLFDEIMVFENGRLADVGSLDDLLKTNKFIIGLMQNNSHKV